MGSSLNTDHSTVFCYAFLRNTWISFPFPFSSSCIFSRRSSVANITRETDHPSPPQKVLRPIYTIYILHRTLNINPSSSQVKLAVLPVVRTSTHFLPESPSLYSYTKRFLDPVLLCSTQSSTKGTHNPPSTIHHPQSAIHTWRPYAFPTVHLIIILIIKEETTNSPVHWNRLRKPFSTHHFDFTRGWSVFFSFTISTRLKRSPSPSPSPSPPSSLLRTISTRTLLPANHQTTFSFYPGRRGVVCEDSYLTHTYWMPDDS